MGGGTTRDSSGRGRARSVARESGLVTRKINVSTAMVRRRRGVVGRAMPKMAL